jgi:putative molybdopterin biosynthesis protein
VFGLPGYPLAAQTVLRLLVAELLETWGWTGPEKKTIPVVLGSAIYSEGGLDEFGLYAAARIGDHYSAIPLSRGSSVQMTGVRSNIIVHIPIGVEGFEAGEIIDAVLQVPEEELDQTILIAGINNESLDRLTEKCMKKGIRIRTGTSNGISALMILMRGACHLASVSDEDDCSFCGEDYSAKQFGQLKFVTKKEITDKKVKIVLDLAADI